jgi:hypothetical protein
MMFLLIKRLKIASAAGLSFGNLNINFYLTSPGRYSTLPDDPSADKIVPWRSSACCGAPQFPPATPPQEWRAPIVADRFRYLAYGLLHKLNGRFEVAVR